MMRILFAAACSLPLLACAPDPEQSTKPATSETADATAAATEAGAMELSRRAARSATPGSADLFTGEVAITPLFEANEESQVGAALVRFEPGAHTAWHRHPLGQRLVVTEGTGWTQVEGGPIEVIEAGDVVWCPPDIRHWHGATPTTAMAHIAIQESENGSPVEWLEHVPDETYDAGPA
jgi:quercetin dioxygenase-like cupin family protein